MKFISINYKMIAISFAGCVLVTMLTIGMMNFVVENYVRGMEDQDVSDTYESLELILNHEEANLKQTNLDWAHWDDTYAYMAGEKKEEYEKSNLQADTLSNLNLNFMFFVDGQGKTVYSLTRNITEEEQNQIISKLVLQPIVFHPLNSSAVRSGIISADQKIFLISLSPITTTNEQTSSSGMLIVGRTIDSGLYYYINAVSKSKVEMRDYAERQGETKQIVERNDDTVKVRRPLTDILGKKGILATVSMPRNEYYLGKHYLMIFAAISVIVVSLIFLLLLIIIHKYFLQRLNQIHQFIISVTENEDYQARLHIAGKDEITKIAESINYMLAEILDVNTINRKVNERVQSILEATEDGYFEYNLKTREYYISPKWSHITDEGRQKDELDPLAEYMKRIHPKYREQAAELFRKLIHGEQNYGEAEYKIIDVTGKEMWVLHKGRVMERDDRGAAVWIVNMMLNVTARKEYEEKILRLSYYDKLTTLRNRAYMEEVFSEMHQHNDLQYHIIMGDVNGLKLVNDTFGHQEGDRLIRTVGEILLRVCGAEDTAARWGGDEFIVLCRRKSDAYVIEMMRKIQEECAAIKWFSFAITIALGYAASQEQGNAEMVMNLAEERMYRNKLTEEKSVRNATITSLERTLYEKNAETEAHTQRIKKLALQVGKKLNLSYDQLCQLELLGLLHDIGKIGIPESVLLKDGPLTEEEWKIMKQHTEIGYRIAMATPGLAHVAEEILCHHERYDGKGYPQGLKGEKIPILSRIINVVDSFDVITHKRVYKEASTQEYALEELNRCRGTQFDPELVDIFKKLVGQALTESSAEERQ